MNIGLNGPKNNYDFIEAIKMDDEEFNSYLNFMENYYANLEKENNLHFFKFKIDIFFFALNYNFLPPLYYSNYRKYE